LAYLVVVAVAAGCGGNDGAGNSYSCNDVKTSTPAANGDVTETRFCQEYMFNYSDPKLAAQAVEINGTLCKVALSSRETATWSPARCPTDSSLISMCADPGNTAGTKRTLYHYYNTINGKPIVDPQLAEAYGCGGMSGSGGKSGGGAGGISGGGGTGGAPGATGTCADLSACCTVIKDATGKSTCLQLETTYQSMVGQGITQAQADSACTTFLQLERSGLLCP
jgi:hypothetical protein